MRILVTGAGGFLGSAIVSALAAEHEVYALLRRAPAVPVAGVHYLEQDLAVALDEAALPTRLDAVIHQAALIDVESLDERDPAPFEVNVIGTWRVLEYAKRAGVSRFIHASTGGVYGHSPDPLVESARPNPMDFYALTKSQAELVVLHTPTDFPKVILRYFLPYGAGTPNPLPRFIGAVLRGEPVTLASDRGPTFNPLHLSDAVAATVLALDLDDDAIINIAGTEVTSYADVADFAAARVGRAVNALVVDRDELIPYYRGELVGSTERMRDLLGYVPLVSLDEGLGELVDELEAERLREAPA